MADISVIDRATIERSGAEGVADVLSKVQGIQIARNGGLGNTTSVYLRGADTRFTAVFIDGVRVDSQATGGAPWEAIPLSQIDRILTRQARIRSRSKSVRKPFVANRASVAR